MDRPTPRLTQPTLLENVDGISITMEITRPPVRVGIFGSEGLALHECANELHQAGYVLNFSSASQDETDNDISIVGMSEFAHAGNITRWKNTPSPFLISGIDSLPHGTAMSEVFNIAVGYIRSAPTLTEILLNLRLGLHWHHERRSHSERISNIETKIENNRIIGMAVGVLMTHYGKSEQYVFDSLKTISRNKQRRISSVANEIIAKHNEDTQTDKPDIRLKSSDLHAWLTDNITMKKR
ncbi:hypothetical protein LCGC14_1273110 [marine sediment metagenome]|uniref:ANTAR domain-containing protein n=1 Tax=marine sediment metagenome TaxID=412755 RepID=A0A0F9P0H6_9ZZZZ|nr:ANTAR domain-containing protein [Methylophaga sp.]